MKNRLLAILSWLGLLLFETLLATNVSVFAVDVEGAAAVVRNVDDDDKNEQWDKDQGELAEEDDLMKFEISVNVDGDFSGSITLSVEEGQERIKFWTDGTKSEELPYTWTVTITDGELQPEDETPAVFFIEGIVNSETWGDVVVKATLSTDDTDTVRVSIIEADLDIDSNNNEGTAFAYGSEEEDKIEASTRATEGWPKRPGKLVVVNSGNTDGVPDWADGFNTNTSDTEDNLLDDGQADFVEVLVERKEPFTDDCEVMFDYEASDPKTVTTISKDAEWNPDHHYAYSLGQDGKLRLWKNESASARNKLDAPQGDYLPKNTWIKWSDLNGGSETITKLYLEAVRPSDSLGDLTIKVTMRETPPEASEPVQATDKVSLTNFEFSSEPVNSSDVSPVRGQMNESTNPAGVSGGYYSGYFEVAVKPANYPNEKINWDATGAWSTASSFTGKWAIINGGVQTGPGKASIDIEGIYTPPPAFKGQSLTLKTIEAKCVVIRDDTGNNPSIPDSPSVSDEAIIDEMLEKVNKIWRQASVIFTRQGAVSYIDKTGYLNGLTESEEKAIISTYDVSDDEVEMYFVPTIEPNVLGVDIRDDGENGLIVACASLGVASGMEDVAKAAAHELGHALFLKDIYWENGPYTIPDGIPAAADKMPDDWNGDYWVAPRYYPQEIAHRDILQRLLMNGYKFDWDEGDYRDIPNGAVYGCGTNGPFLSYKGKVNVGLNTLLEHDRKSHH